jgi:signal transduction histidine kinase
MRTRLGLRARLTLLCLGLSVLCGGIFMVAMNIVVSIELVSLYSRPPIILNLDSSTATADMLAARHTANDEADQAAHEIRLQSLAAFGVLIVVAAGLCWFASGRALRPIRQITATAESLTQETLDKRIAFSGPHDELWTLAASFDHMLGRLARAFDGQQLFVANASHELRGPLTVIRTASEVALAKPARPEADYRRTLATINRAVQRSERMLDSLLRLARTQHQRAGLEPVDLAAIAHNAIRPDPYRRVEFREDLTPATVRGDQNLLDLMMRNLIDNAVKYNIRDGWITVRTRLRGDTAVLDVENTGLPIATAQIPNLLRPFQRGNHARIVPGDGFGLGLAIVDAITHAHNGHLSLTPRTDGGLLVTATFATTNEPSEPRCCR